MESSAYKRLRDNVSLPHDRVDRVENVVLAGMPDINYCIDGVEGWVELKSPTEPKRPTTSLFGSNHRLTQDQINWFLRHTMAGGIGWVLISTDKRWMLISADHAEVINNRTVSELLSIATWSVTKPVKKELWKSLRVCLALKQRHTSTNLNVSSCMA